MARRLFVEFYQDNASEWRWRKKAGNGEKLANSGEGYKEIKSALRGLEIATGDSLEDWQLKALERDGSYETASVKFKIVVV